jgi:hypothetical protein
MQLSHKDGFTTFDILVGTELTARVLSLEFIVVTKAATIHKLGATPLLAVVIPHRVVSLTGTGNFGKETCI